MRTKISQTEARRLARRVKALESQLADAKRQYWPNMEGTHIATVNLGAETALTAIRTAARLGYGVRVQLNGPSAEFIAIDPGATP
jgi:hypothetical protein